MAVWGRRWRRPRPAATAWWSVVGGTTTEALLLKVTSPTLKRAGSRFTNSSAAFRATVMRLGLMSLATIDPELSMATMIVARSLGTLASDPGRANAVISSATTVSIVAKAHRKVR